MFEKRHKSPNSIVDNTSLHYKVNGRDFWMDFVKRLQTKLKKKKNTIAKPTRAHRDASIA